MIDWYKGMEIQLIRLYGFHWYLDVQEIVKGRKDNISARIVRWVVGGNKHCKELSMWSKIPAGFCQCLALGSSFM